MSDQPEHLRNLNPEQLAAVTHKDGPILVFAGAGSGKTRVLTRRVAHLVLEHHVPARRILAVTFTNKAAGEMKERLRVLLGDTAVKDLWSSTFHSAGLRMLRRNAQHIGYSNDFVVYDDDDSKSLMKQLLKELSVDEKRFTPNFFLSAIDRAKNSYLSPDGFAKSTRSYEGSLQAEVYEKYQRKLVEANAMDFGDLLFNALRLLLDVPQVATLYQQGLDYILVDEFQDTNYVQYQLLKILAERHRNIFAVGDDDQSIYGFRGANIENILNFERDFPSARIIKLEQNYRSTGNILSLAHAVIEKNKSRKEKQLWSNGPAGAPVHTYLAADEGDEAYFIAKEIRERNDSGTPYRDMAILYRTNAQSRALEDTLLSLKIPYRIFGALRFYDRKEIKDILAFLKLALNEYDSQSFLRVVNTPPRGIGAQAVQSVVTLAAEKSCAFMVAARELAAKQKGLAAFSSLMDGIIAAIEKLSLSKLMAFVIDESGYRAKLKEMKDDTATSRLENLRELEALALSCETRDRSTRELLREFLDRVTLTSSGELPIEEQQDSEKTAEPQYVSLMTLHLAKGLEFPSVFLTGLEEGLLPHYRSMTDRAQIEEERRLCYVGITRAKERLYLTRAMKRGMFSMGDPGMSTGLFREPSRFAYDFPKTILEARGPDFLSGQWDLETGHEELSIDESEEQEFTGWGWKKKKKQRDDSGDVLSSVMSADDLLKRK